MKPKSIITLLLGIAASLCLATQCPKEENPNELPPETQEGKNTLGCLIDGEVFTKSHYGATFQPNFKVVYQKGEIVINSYLNPSGHIQLVIDSIFSVNSHPIKLCLFSPEEDNAGCSYYGGWNIGNVILTKMDTINRIVSGRFNFDGQCSNFHIEPCDEIFRKITDGRFDAKF